jgi:hypothetical protein
MKLLNFLFYVFCLVWLINTKSFGQVDSIASDVSVIKKVADNILSHTTYDYMIGESDKIVRNLTADDIKPSIRPNSPYNE